MMKKVVIVGLLVLVVLAGVGLGKEIVVTNTADSGTGSLRWALQTARSGDTITFDPSVFPPDDPATILVRSEIPPLLFGNLTIDASNAGVILNGELSETSGVSGIVIRSAANVVQGLQIVNFSQCGIFMSGLARNNTIGGDRNTGNGPFGQGNAIGQCNGGIVLWGMQATGNTILGNVIGTDITGTENLGNVDGATIGGGGTRNVIGPDNLIAHNRESGVLIDGPDTSGNTITQNRIWNNGWAGIRFEGFYTSDADFVVETVDPVAGLISGRACAGCVIEFFSDTDLQGAVYEGRTTASEDGLFQLSTGTALSGPNLTATRTDARGTTNRFLGPFDISAVRDELQKSNNLPSVPFVGKRSGELQDNWIGDLWSGMWQAPDYGHTFDTNVFGLGLKRIRIAVNSADIATVNWSHPEFWIDPTYDALISTLAEQGHRIRYILSFWDKDNSSSQQTLPCERFSTQEDVDRYLEFVRFIVRHFSDRVEGYEIWNEPNVAPDCGQQIALGDYLNLVRSVVPVIREEAPKASIVIGSVTPLPFLGAKDYLFGILESDVLPLVDGISWHVGGPSLEYDEWRDYWLAYPSIVREIKETAWANGFSGEFIGDELIWRTPLNPHPLGAEQWLYSPAVSAKYFARGIVMERGMDLTVGLALDALEVLPLMVRAITNLCTVMAESEAVDLPVEIDIETDGLVAYCAFRYPNGDRILAIWTDGIAQDEDLGIPATITLPGLTAGTVTGIDVLDGFAQELVFEIDGDDTVVRDLLVKDYPILIRLSDITFGPNYEETVGDGFHRLGALTSMEVAASINQLAVTSAEDHGQGTLRWALVIARSGDIIMFDPDIFPPDAPATIRLTSMLPILTQGNLTIDASDAGVILDGSGIPGENTRGLEILSDGNMIRGLQIVSFTGAGIQLVGGAQHNAIGGDRTIGSGLLGQGNLCSGNNGGICIWDEATSHNTITGNLIGTDVTGTKPFGNIDGMFVSGGASHNTIGPGNIIAYNREHAIVIQGASSVGNTITQNSIHSNGWGGIHLLEGGNNELPPPLITSFDRITGALSGIACPNGTVEIFSDSGDQGEKPEGQTLADEAGAFQFVVENATADQYLTATATSPTGNTSAFSQPASGTRREATIQDGNTFPREVVQERSSEEAVGNQLTVGLWSGLWQPHDYDKILETEILSLGSHPVLLAVNHLDSISVNWLEPEWPISDNSDAWISALADNGISIRYGLSFWDKAGYAAGSPAPCERFTTEQDIQRYLEFVRNVVTHFAGRIDSFEIWNEPDVERCWQYIPVEQYIELVRRTVPVLRELAPEAEVVIGSTTPFVKDINCGGYEYLMALVESDAVALADAIAWHVGAPSPQFDDWREVYENYDDLTRTIVETARANGFDGRFIADELNWRSTLNPHPYGAEPWAYTPTTAAKYYARGALMNLGLGFDIGFAGLSSFRETVFKTVKNLCLALDGVEAVQLAVEIDIETEGPVAYCSFRYPNGDRMLAIWTDGIAQDEGLGVPATITFPGLTAGSATGIDVLHGFEQELVFETDGEDTIVRDLLIKDYPILIRLSNPIMSSDYEETVGDGFHRLGDVSELPSSTGSGSDRDGDGVPDDKDYCPDWPGSTEANGC